MMRRYRPCPRCRQTLLEPVRFDQTEVDACPRCGGLYFDAGELAEVIKTSVGSAPDQNPLGPPHGASEMVCPGCGDDLQVHRFREGPTVGVASESATPSFDVDLCHHCHGLWLDRGELEAVQRARAQEIIDSPKTWKTWLFQFLLQLPVEFNLEPRRFPIVTLLLVITNVLIFAGLIASPNPRDVLDALALFPARFPDGQYLLSLLSHQLLHGGPLHLLMNMYFLYIIGDNVEDVLGRGGFIAFYVAAGIVGGLGHTLLAWGDTTPMVGASGAIAGVMAAYAVFFRRAKLTFMLIVFQFKLSAPWFFAIWIGLNLLGLLLGAGGVAWGAHLGGFLFGLSVALAADRRVRARHPLLRLLGG